MISYVPLLLLVAVVMLGVLRALRHRPRFSRVRQKEPSLATHPTESEHTEAGRNSDFIETAPDEGVSFVRPASDKSHVVLDPQPSTKFTVPASKQECSGVTIPDFLRSDASCVHQFEEEMFLYQDPNPPKVGGNLLVLHLMAEPGRPYQGLELKQAILNTGMRYGKHRIFHRFSGPAGRGDILFSLASAVEPGTFDPFEMAHFSTPGLVLFMQTSAVPKPVQTFELLLSTANQLIQQLDGSLLDADRSSLSSEVITAWREHLDAQLATN